MAATEIPKSTGMIKINTDRRLPGPFQSYSYPAFINSPSEMGMKGETSGWGLDTIGTNFGGLISYVELLVTGNSRASKAASIRYPLGGKRTGAPLGNAYIFNTGLKCKSNVDGSLKDAVAYMNNIPLGNIPLISTFGAGNVQELRGLLPGIFENLNGFNPMIIVDALEISNNELCQKEMETEQAYSLPLTNITPDGKDYVRNKPPVQFSRIYTFPSIARTIDPCLFRGDGVKASSRINPETKEKCRESFTNMNSNLHLDNMQNKIEKNLEYLRNLNEDDWIIQLYYISVSIIIIFIIIKVFNKHKTI